MKSKTSSANKKNVYGVFGYLKLKKHAFLILIEEASIVGQILRGTVFRVEKLMFVPVTVQKEIRIWAED